MATNDFMTFAGDPAADVMLQSDYLASSFTARILGFSTGTAISTQLNKVWRQASLISSMIGQFTVDVTGQNMLDDGTPSGMTALETNFRSAIATVASGAIGTGYLPLTGGTLTGNLTINNNLLQMNATTGQSATINLNRTAGHNAMLGGYTGTSQRWGIALADNASEQGSNTGSNFDIMSYTDAGVQLDTPLSINRATGVVNFTHPPTFAGGALPYVPIAGGTMTGALGVGGTGLAFPGVTAGGTFWGAHHTAFGWDGTWIQIAVDGTAIGQIATASYTQTQLGNYLPLTGGALSGALTIHSSLRVDAAISGGSSVSFGNQSDFVNFSDSNYRYRQWAGNWYDSWQPGTGVRYWVGATGVLMTLDYNGNLSSVGNLRAQSGRVFSYSTTTTPSVCAYYNVGGGVAVGFWCDNSGMWLGNMDGSANPTSPHMLLANSGYFTLYSSGQINGSLTVSNSISASGDIYANGSCEGNTVTSNGYVWANNRMVAQSNFPAFASNNTTSSVACTRWCDPGGIEWATSDGNGNPGTTLMNLSWAGRLSCSGGVNVSDERVKHDIAPSEPFDSLSAIRALKSMEFAWDVDNKRQPFGFLAGEVRPHLPDVVEKIDGLGGLDGIDVLALLTHAIRAIQQIADTIEGESHV